MPLLVLLYTNNLYSNTTAREWRIQSDITCYLACYVQYMIRYPRWAGDHHHTRQTKINNTWYKTRCQQHIQLLQYPARVEDTGYSKPHKKQERWVRLGLLFEKEREQHKLSNTAAELAIFQHVSAWPSCACYIAGVLSCTANVVVSGIGGVGYRQRDSPYS